MDGDLGSLVKQLMSDEKTQEKVMDMLGGILGDSGERESVEDEAEREKLPALPAGVDIASLYKSLGSVDDKRVRLLSALRPYLCDRRKPKLDSAISIVRVASVSQSLGLLKLFEGE